MRQTVQNGQSHVYGGATVLTILNSQYCCGPEEVWLTVLGFLTLSNLVVVTQTNPNFDPEMLIQTHIKK